MVNVFVGACARVSILSLVFVWNATKLLRQKKHFFQPVKINSKFNDIVETTDIVFFCDDRTTQHDLQRYRAGTNVTANLVLRIISTSQFSWFGFHAVLSLSRNGADHAPHVFPRPTDGLRGHADDYSDCACSSTARNAVCFIS